MTPPASLPLSIFALAASFLPCAAAELRPLSTDRPDVTESPHTVDAGHFQFEMEIANWTKDGGEREFALGELNAKYGLSRSTDLQLVLPFYNHVRGGDEGFGDTEIRLKWNLWGNDEGSTALAVMPFVKLPTANGDLGNGEVEGGLIVPFGFELPAGWDATTMAEFDLNADDDGDGYELVTVTSISVGHDLTECTGVFLELVSEIGTDGSSTWEAYFNTGITWAVTPTWQLDGGIRVGLTSAAADLTPFLGVSTKF